MFSRELLVRTNSAAVLTDTTRVLSTYWTTTEKCTFYFYVRTKPDRSSNSVLVIGFIVVFEFLMRCVTNLLLRFEREGCNERKRERGGIFFHPKIQTRRSATVFTALARFR